jgi:hypothetical protein
MLAQIIVNFIVFLIKLAVWIVVAFLAVPIGITMALNHFFPLFVSEANFGFWTVLSLLTIVAYVIFWKPILWIVSTINILGAEY